MATTTIRIVTPVSRQEFRVSRGVCITSFPKYALSSCVAVNGKYPIGINFVCERPFSIYVVKPTCALGSGFQASISDDSAISVKGFEIAMVSQDDEKIQVRVDLTGKDTQIIFDKVLTNLAREAPPVPGFRRQKGGKTSKIPKDFLLRMLGENRVINFVIQEIVTSTMVNYVTKENLAVKDKVSTTQTAEELKSSFAPGNAFGFDAILELEKSATDIQLDHLV